MPFGAALGQNSGKAALKRFSSTSSVIRHYPYTYNFTAFNETTGLQFAGDAAKAYI
ncbi:MAG TPA: hypothetical protein VG738_01095 [Chitinophagaceae bacterium]|nr:hypothetical protein [Chitinophagaceae bacterium]